jgi:hypothetical protein
LLARERRRVPQACQPHSAGCCVISCCTRRRLTRGWIATSGRPSGLKP